MLPTCWKTSEDLEHILVRCPAHREARTRVLAMWADYLATRPHLATVVHHYTSTPGTHLIQFLVDPSVLPLVITLGQEHGEDAINALFYLTRTFCYSIRAILVNQECNIITFPCRHSYSFASLFPKLVLFCL